MFSSAARWRNARRAFIAVCLIAVAACGANAAPPAHPGAADATRPGGGSTKKAGANTTAATVPDPTIPAGPSPGVMPALLDPTNIYSETTLGKLAPSVAGAPGRVYVPSTEDGSITVIDEQTGTIVETLHTGGKLVQHVVVGWDMKTLYANVSGNNQLFEIDPMTAKPTGTVIPVPAPYNLYFSPDGTKAIVMAERLDRIDWYDRATWTKVASTVVPCKSQMPGAGYGGVNHADWSADGSFFLATCEFAGDMIKVDTASMQVVDQIHLSGGAMPQDVRITPDGSKFYVADMQLNGMWVLDAGKTVADKMTITGKIYTGKGTHGIYPSRDANVFYVTNRGHLANETGRRSKPGEGSVSVVDWRTDKILVTWPIDKGGSPDMGGVSADGSTLWLSGRYDAEVYAFDTRTGQMKFRIPVPAGPHGLAVFPQPGRYSLGHTGNFR